MSAGAVQYEFGYFGKLPTLGDFVHQSLPQDFANRFHEWLQATMAGARETLGDDFLTYYLNCPAWKFLMSAGVCGAQPMAGLTIPSVDRVGRYFNFTIATVLPLDCDPIAYALANRDGFEHLELVALDVLERDPPKDEIDSMVQGLGPQFSPAGSAGRSMADQSEFIHVSLDEPLPLCAQAGVLLSDRLERELGPFSGWWFGREGQSTSNLIVCGGMPSASVYLELLTLQNPLDASAEDKSYVDKVIAGEV
jgi:type VI secretion system protein ImpM